MPWFPVEVPKLMMELPISWNSQMNYDSLGICLKIKCPPGCIIKSCFNLESCKRLWKTEAPGK